MDSHAHFGTLSVIFLRMSQAIRVSLKMCMGVHWSPLFVLNKLENEIILLFSTNITHESLHSDCLRANPRKHIKVNLLRTLQREAEQSFEDEVRNCAQQKQMCVELDYKATFPQAEGEGIPLKVYA